MLNRYAYKLGMAALTIELAEKALQSVKDPVFDRSLTELGLIDALTVDGTKVCLTVKLATPSEAHKARVLADIERVLEALGATEVAVSWELHVPTRDATGEDPLPGVKNVILVMSGKGGVGKSTTAANIALALQQSGARVGLLDADVYGPSVPTMFGLEGPMSSADGVHIEPLERFGLKLMSIGFLFEPKKAVIWRGPMLSSSLKQFLRDVHWGALDYLVLDLPPGTGDVAITLSQAVKVTGAIIVTTPQEVALQDVYRSVQMCEQLRLPILGVVENMSYFIDSAGVKQELFGSGGGALIAEFAKAPLLGQIPLEMSVREWGDKGTPVVQAAPTSASAKAFIAVAEELASRIAQAHFQRTGGTKAPATAGPTRLKIVR